MALSRYTKIFGTFGRLNLGNRNFCAKQNDGQYYALFYDYVDDILEKRKPVRADHLKHITEYVEDGRCKLGGGWADNNVDGALIVFQCQDKSEIEDFVKCDPYYQNGLVTNYKIRPWTVVIGTCFNK